MTGRVLYDGWPLIHAPLSAAAWHLRTLLALNPKDVQPILALPTEPEVASVANGFETTFSHVHDRGEWEQRSLQRLAMEHKTNLIHSTSLAASLFGKIPTLISPAELEAGNRSRIGEALGRGGLARATILWPEDLPAIKLPREVKTLPPVVHPDFSMGATTHSLDLNLPDEFLLVDGIPSEEAAFQLLESWTWAAASIGELYPLVITNVSDSTQKFLLARLPEFHVEESVRLITQIIAKDIPGLYQKCAALVHLGNPAPWGNPLRNALSCGKAIVAQNEPSTEAIVSSAGYLISKEDLRGFGAAMITVVVDEKAREKLEDAAKDRAAHWSEMKFKGGLMEIYGARG
jgi:glycosyltransferase involved in cell wall biosynthesis